MCLKVFNTVVRGQRAAALQADRFVRTGRNLRRQMWWQNCKMKVVVGMAVLLLVIILFVLICFSGRNCIKKS